MTDWSESDLALWDFFDKAVEDYKYSAFVRAFARAYIIGTSQDRKIIKTSAIEVKKRYER